MNNFHAQVKIYEQRQKHKIEKLERFFKMSIVDIIKQYKLPTYILYIIDGNEKELKTKYPNIHKNILSCAHATDQRTPLQYARDVALAWIFETYVMQNLRMAGLELERNGGDKNYNFLQGTDISSDSDFKVRGRRLELICNYTDYWTRYNYIDLRESKAKHLYQYNSLVLGITLDQPYCLLINFAKYLPNEYIPEYPPFGGKSAHKILITDDMKVGVNFNEIADKINYIITHQESETRLLDFGFQPIVKSYYLKCDACKIPLFFKKEEETHLKYCPKCKRKFTSVLEVNCDRKN